MTRFGLDERSLLSHISRVSGDPTALTPDAAAELFARAAWTGIAEPGDRVAGALLSAVGGTAALEMLIERWSPERIAAVALDAGIAIALDDFALAIARWIPRVNSAAATLALERGGHLGIRLVAPGDEAWPPGVDDLGDFAPVALWLRGRPEVTASLGRSIALVGARAATGYGEHLTMEASAGLVDRGFLIVSGAAYGIDGMAHRAALASSGLTVAVLAGGLDRFYPSGHDALLSRIVDVGAVISELPCGAPPTKWRFLQRNRLIAAMSQATVVLEAGWRSGSLNTAGHASALGRPLGAVPGPVTSAASAGCHRLIRDFDAVLVTNATEMAELVGLDAGATTGETIDSITDSTTDLTTVASPGAASDANTLPPSHLRVIDGLSRRSPRETTDVAARAGLSVAEASAVLGLLEIEGRTRNGERGWTLK